MVESFKFQKMKSTLILFILFLTNIVDAQKDIDKKLSHSECGRLGNIVQEHKTLGRRILTTEKLGPLYKRIKLSKLQFQIAIDKLEIMLDNDCNQAWHSHYHKFQIVDCLIHMEEFDKAFEALMELEINYRYDVYPRGPYTEQFYEYYFRIHERRSVYDFIRKNGVLYDCGNEFYKHQPKYLLEQSIKNSKILYDKKAWKYLVLYLQSLPISLSVSESDYAAYYKVLNQFLIAGLLNLYDPKELISELEFCNIQDAKAYNYHNFSFILKLNTHFLTIKNLQFGLEIENFKGIISEEVRKDIIDNLWLTIGIKNAINAKE